jgi:hypothetical protein
MWVEQGNAVLYTKRRKGKKKKKEREVRDNVAVKFLRLLLLLAHLWRIGGQGLELGPVGRLCAMSNWASGAERIIVLPSTAALSIALKSNTYLKCDTCRIANQ